MASRPSAIRPCLGPAEADAPLLVDADAVRACSVPAKSFQSVPARHAQIVQIGYLAAAKTSRTVIPSGGELSAELF